MPDHALAFSPSEPDPDVLGHVAVAERVTLSAVITLVAMNLAASHILFLGRMFVHSWHLISADSAFIILFTALSLVLSKHRHSRLLSGIGLVLTILVVLSCTAILIAHLPLFSHSIGTPFAGARSPIPFTQKSMSPKAASGFVLLGLAIIFIPAHKRTASFAADLLIACAVFQVLVVVSGHFLGLSHLFAPYALSKTSSQTMLCLLALTGVAFFRRAGNGVFSILLLQGVGSRIARFLFPALLILPFVREAIRARLINVHRMPPHYITALVATVAVVMSTILLLIFAWYINHQEVDIRDLSLRDALTGLYNLRGFRLLAEQALRLAHRSGLPFSVLFIDLDNLKQTNDLFGHQTGSELLQETAKVLQNAFRETDVVGRIGGDEFAVAGQLSPVAVNIAVRRLEESVAQRNTRVGRPMTLTFSSGYATSKPARRESLDELLAKADEAMYEAKRRKKELVT